MSRDVERSLLDKILGAFCGQALGDAFGMPSELWPRKRVQGHFGWIDDFLDGPEENDAARYFRAGEITDDTSMALAIADAIIELDGDIEAECIARHILQWVDQFDAFSKKCSWANIQSRDDGYQEGNSHFRANEFGCDKRCSDAHDAARMPDTTTFN